MAVMAHALVTSGLKQVYSSNLLVTCSAEGTFSGWWFDTASLRLRLERLSE